MTLLSSSSSSVLPPPPSVLDLFVRDLRILFVGCTEIPPSKPHDHLQLFLQIVLLKDMRKISFFLLFHCCDILILFRQKLSFRFLVKINVRNFILKLLCSFLNHQTNIICPISAPFPHFHKFWKLCESRMFCHQQHFLFCPLNNSTHTKTFSAHCSLSRTCSNILYMAVAFLYNLNR